MKLMNRALNLKIFIIAVSVAFSGCAGISLPTRLTPSDDTKEEQSQKDTAESDKTIIEELEKQSYKNGKLKLEPNLKNGKQEGIEKYYDENCNCIRQEYIWKSDKWQLLPP